MRGDNNESSRNNVFKNQKLLIDKTKKRPTYQMIGGRIEDGESPLEAAIRECHEELGNEAIFDNSLFELEMEFDEIVTSDGVTPIHFYVFKYNGELKGKIKTSYSKEQLEKMFKEASRDNEIKGLVFFSKENYKEIYNYEHKKTYIPELFEKIFN